MVNPFIDDGWTESGYIAEAPGLHPACRFEYRPMLRSEIYRCAREAEKATDDYLPVLAKWLAKKLVAWDLCGKDGRPAATTPDVLLRLRPRLLDRLVDVVWGREPSDPDPDGKAPAKFDQDAAEKN